MITNTTNYYSHLIEKIYGLVKIQVVGLVGLGLMVNPLLNIAYNNFARQYFGLASYSLK